MVISKLDLEKLAGLKNALHDGEITLSNEQFDDLYALAKLGLEAKAFLDEHGDAMNEGLVNSDDLPDTPGSPEGTPWGKRLDKFERLLIAARALDQEKQPRASVGAGTEET